MDQLLLSQKQPVRQFLAYALPAVLGMFLSSFIIVVDGLFIGRFVGSRGLATTNLVVPFLYLLLGISIMIYVGGMVPATHNLGRGDFEEASRIFSITFTLGTISIFLVMLLAGFFFDELLTFLNLEGELRPFGRDYLGVLLYFYIFMTINIGFSIFLRTEGKPVLSLFFSLAGNCLNLLLDYLFIVVYGWGMRGAALATGIALLLPFLCGLFYFLSGRSLFRLVVPRCRMREIVMLLYNGSSEMIGQFSVSITTFIFNAVLLRRIGVDGVAAYTVAGYIIMLQGMVLTGIIQGLAPLVGRAYGAKDILSVKRFFRIAVYAAFIVGILSFAACAAASSLLPRLYNVDNPRFLTVASTGLLIVSFSFLLNGFNIVTTAFFTALGKAGHSALIAILRGVVIINIFVLILPRFLGDLGIWLSIPANELLVAAAAFFLLRLDNRELVVKSNG
ncbi:MATE family efflux transporter [Sediminispirochaeta bajacaliforniensis]|uniref:MATE family efflux transporter n=1 Tax=Sediminispirochaeta bajacaliforniensis TaxID=148 RepID=UPI0003811564|nr:MATE family efflux transporter [Sediminispirochaeta bajacaliforniensis]